MPEPGTTRYVRNSAVLSANLGLDEKALLSAARGRYYGLNGPASRIWDLLATPRSVAEICEALMAEFEVDLATCLHDTTGLVAELLQEGLISTFES